MKDLNKLYRECIKELDSIDIKYGNIVSVIVNTRAKKRWGQCKIIRNANSWNDRKYEISVSSRLLADNVPDMGTKETIIHEILHSCYGSNNHGPEWKNNVNVVNYKLGYNIKRKSTSEDKGIVISETVQEYNYVFKCNKCGQLIRRIRKCKFIEHPELYHCGLCGGRFDKIK